MSDCQQRRGCSKLACLEISLNPPRLIFCCANKEAAYDMQAASLRLDGYPRGGAGMAGMIGNVLSNCGCTTSSGPLSLPVSVGAI